MTKRNFGKSRMTPNIKKVNLQEIDEIDGRELFTA
jgi:hypothetical protein